MRKHVLAARGGAARSRRLHGESRKRQTFEEARERIGVAFAKFPRMVQPFRQRFLHEPPGDVVDGFVSRAQRVCDDPVRPARDLGHEVGVAGGRQGVWRPAQHADVRHDATRRAARDGLLEALRRHGRAMRGKAVHGGGRGDAEVAAVELFRGELAEIVDRPRADGDGDGLVRLEVLAHAFHLGQIRMGRLFEDHRLGRGDACRAQRGVHLPPGGAQRVGVGDDAGGLAGEQRLEHVRRTRQHVFAQPEHSCVGRAVKRLLDS